MLSSPSNRTYYFDNAKFLLILLVVTGHIIEPLRESSRFFKAVYILIYLFHMPCFVMISGYFAQKRKKPFELIKFLLLYGFFQWIFALAAGQDFIFLHPLWVLWYLFAWIVWNLSLRFIPRKHKVIFVVSMFLLGLIIGYIPHVSYYLSLSRIISFYPFFLLGYYSDRWWLWREKRRYQTIILKASSILLLSTFFLILYLMFANIDPYAFIYYSYPYAETSSPIFLAWIFRLSAYAVSIITGLAFFLLIPQQRTPYTYLGRNTMQVYLLHACILYPLYSLDIYNKIETTSEKFFILILGLIITVLLCSKFFSYLFHKIELIVDPKKQIDLFVNKLFEGILPIELDNDKKNTY